MFNSNRKAMLAAISVIACTHPAYAAPQNLVEQAMALIDHGKAADAYRLLRPALADRAADPDYNYALGLAAVDSGHVTEAIQALQRVLAVNPDQAQARAELARAYALSGDIDTARREFDVVSGDPTIPDPVRQRFTTLVKGIEHTLKPGGSVTGFLEASGGYDSNVNAATSATQIVIPVFSFLGPATLSSNARKQADGFGSIEGGASAEYGFNRQSRVFASVLASGRFNGSQTGLNQALGTATIGYAHTAANRDVASISLQTQQFFLAGDHYRAASGLVAQYTHLLPGGHALSAQAQFFDVTYPTDRLRDARRFGLGVNYVTRTIYVAVQGGHEQTRAAAADNLSNSFGGIRVAFERSVATKIAVFGAVAFEARRYDAPDPLFLIARRDNQYDTSVGLRFRLTPHVTVNPQVSYTRNDSNIAIDSYDRVTASAAIRFEF
ncbi:surface lipoprotein assembly modifier [Novosphingobium sp.]|uniref:surface lipoprotein assembly modifier n=1 Tax=Novosphingobium sp. TaxID=1874826 RepID=UPI0025D8D820|nr:surface lipoprotein assembly modifier [Novosphingobium sp.]